METKPKHHQVPVVRIKEILPHNNADSLELIPIEGFQVVVKKGEYKIGDLAYYIYPDSVVPVREEFEWLWKDRITNPDGTWRDGLKEVPLKYRRISVRRFRGQWSEGLLMPLKSALDLYNPKTNPLDWKEGEDVSDLLGITHYEPPEPAEFGGDNEKGPKGRPRTLKGWIRFIGWKIAGLFGYYHPMMGTNEKGPANLPPHYDVENFKNYKNAFEEGEQVVVTEKLHGCQGRYVYQDGHMYAGSRNYWKHPKSKNIWRKALQDNPWIEEWCKANEGFTLYGELLPCQGPSFQYGIEKGLTTFHVFDILDPSHEWLASEAVLTNMKINPVPILFTGPYETSKVIALADGKSIIDKTHKTVREGVVIKPAKERHIRGLGRLKLKIVSNTFLEKS